MPKLNYQPSSPNRSITVGWLYPELMSTYGDRGNILVLKHIAEENKINSDVIRIDQTASPEQLSKCDLLFMGGAQDLQQEMVMKDLSSGKGNTLNQMIEDGTPGLYICGAYQFLGKYYKDSYRTTIPGLGVFDMYTESFKSKPRLIGNIVVKPESTTYNVQPSTHFVGFENHGGRTYLGTNATPFVKVIKGFGNNGEDKTEGIHYKNSIGTYLHGPILSSNPELAIYLLELAYEKKYSEKLKITFSYELSKKAKTVILKRFKINT